MLPVFRRNSGHPLAGFTRSRPRRSRTCELGLEALEGRVTLSLVGSEFLVNSTTRNAQFASDNASSSNGMSVAVWVDTYSNTDHDIRAQLYNSSGLRAGQEILVDYTTIDSGEPKVAMDSRGDFVVTWTNSLPGGNSDVEARMYNSAGNPVTNIFAVANTGRPEHASDVAMDANGNFVVSYTFDYSSSDQDIYAQRYSNTGQLRQIIPVATTTHNESRSSVAMAPDGRFDIAYQYQYSTSDDDIYLARYSAAGSLLGRTPIATSVALERAPSVAMNNFGDAVVAYTWQSGHIKAKRVSSSGLVGGEIDVGTTMNTSGPSVALSRTGRSFVVAYDYLGIDYDQATHVTEVSASDTIVASYFTGWDQNPAISIDGNGYYFLTYSSNGRYLASDSGDYNILGRFGHLS